MSYLIFPRPRAHVISNGPLLQQFTSTTAADAVELAQALKLADVPRNSRPIPANPTFPSTSPSERLQ